MHAIVVHVATTGPAASACPVGPPSVIISITRIVYPREPRVDRTRSLMSSVPIALTVTTAAAATAAAVAKWTVVSRVTFVSLGVKVAHAQQVV